MDCNLNILLWISFVGLIALIVILLLKSFLKDFYFVIKILVFAFYYDLVNFNDIVCGC